MKKIFNRNFLFLISFCALLISIEVGVPRKNDLNTDVVNDSKINGNNIIETKTEDTPLADLQSCLAGCNNSCLGSHNTSTYCTKYCNSYCNPNTTTCCCTASGGRYTSCSIKYLQDCTFPYVNAGDYSAEACAAKVTPSDDDDEDDNKPTPTPKPCVISGMTAYNVLSNGSTRTVIVQTSNCGGTATVSGTNGISASGVSSNKDTHNFTIKVNGKCDSIGSYTFSIGGKTLTQKALIMNDWQVRENVTIDHNPGSFTQAIADIASNWEYGICIPNGDKYFCPVYGWRSCGNPGTAPSSNVPTPVAETPKTQVVYACYANNADLTKATVARWQSGTSADASIKISNVTEATCIATPKIDYCNPKDEAISPTSTDASSCESNVELKFKDGRSCNGDSYYKITCGNADNKIVASYDNGDDKSNENEIKIYNYLLPGQGFQFGINVEVQRKCTATFDNNTWNDAYNKTNNVLTSIKDRRNSAKTDKDKEYLTKLENEYNNIKKDLVAIVTEYNSYYDAIDNYNKTASSSADFDAIAKKLIKLDLSSNVGLTYPTENGIKTIKSNYVKTIDKGTIVRKIDKTTSLANGTNVREYSWDNYESSNAKPYKIRFVFPQVYIEKKSGTILTSSNTNSIDGGNKLYIDYDAKGSKVGVESYMSITINGKNTSSTSNTEAELKIKNNKCGIKVFNVELKYRPIEISNPFINNSYLADLSKKDVNWINSKYDFTKVIKADTWEKSSTLYTNELTATEMDDLKKSNENHSSSMPYLGLCGKESSADDITKKICDSLKGVN